MAEDISADMPAPEKLWEHPSQQSTNMARFMREANAKHGLNMKTFRDLYAWSTGDSRADFWRDIWAYAELIHEGSIEEIVEPNVRMDATPRWFRGVRLNFAENILFARAGTAAAAGKDDARIACTQVREGSGSAVHVSWGALRARVGRLASAMRARGVVRGERVGVVASNSVDTLVVFLAVTSLGGLFSSASTDMGVKGILDRMTQIRPRWVFMDDAAVYNGRTVDLREKMREIVRGMDGIGEFEGLVTMPRWGQPVDVRSIEKCRTLDEYLQKATTDKLEFVRVEFSDPFLIMYSSGTTGQPKCIVHSVGGVLISSAKEALLHRDFGPDTVALQYTTTGWIMYLTCILALVHGSRGVLYDGSPFQPDAKAFVRLIGDQKVTHLGISPRWMQTLVSQSLSPCELTNLSNLRNVTSTGMVLSDALFRWFYESGFPPQVQLANISGGTDLAGCFGCENPLTPVYVGGCQGPCLGTPIAVYDSSIEGGPGVEGLPVEKGVPGDLVATKAFPNMPVFFWGDEDGKRYFDAYFAKYDNVWTHGDFVQIHPQTDQLVFLGRADGVLNPSGVRFGSAEIYSVIEKWFAKEIVDSIVVGQRRPEDTDESVMLFLKMQPDVSFSSSLVSDIKDAIAQECSKRHVPKYIFETPEIPTTVNMKKVELPVKHIVSGRTVKPSGTLLNPDSLNFYYKFAKVEEQVKGQHKL